MIAVLNSNTLVGVACPAASIASRWLLTLKTFFWEGSGAVLLGRWDVSRALDKAAGAGVIRGQERCSEPREGV